MSLDKLTAKEKEWLNTDIGVYAVIMGYLKAERGKIAPSVFNKLSQELGLKKQKLGGLQWIAEQIHTDKDLESLYNKSFDREIKLDDLKNPDPELEDCELNEKQVFDNVTNFIVDNELHKANLRELRKIQREGAYMNILIDGLKKHIVEELKGMPRSKYIKTEVPKPVKGDKSLILCVSDWHIGALVHNEDTGGYDFHKLIGSMQSLTKQVSQIVSDFDIKHVYMFHIGDTIEHISMRNVNQAFDAEFNTSEQIAKAERLIIDMLAVLSKSAHVTFGMVAGNHDRFNGNKNDKVYNDNATYIILDHLFMVQEEFGALPNVTLIDNRADTYEFTIRIAGKNFKVKHGDHEKKNDDRKIPKHIKTEVIDYYIMGHIHTARIVQEDYSRFQVYVSSPMGANDFSKDLNLPTTQGSQLIMVMTEGSDTPMFMPVMFNKEGNIE